MPRLFFRLVLRPAYCHQDPLENPNCFSTSFFLEKSEKSDFPPQIRPKSPLNTYYRAAPSQIPTCGFPAHVNAVAIYLSSASYGAVSALGGLRVPLRPAWFLCTLHPCRFIGMHACPSQLLGTHQLLDSNARGFSPFLHMRNTRFILLVRLCITGIFTLSEAPRFAWRTNDQVQSKSTPRSVQSIA